jgi:hypothetical protein
MQRWADKWVKGRANDALVATDGNARTWTPDGLEPLKTFIGRASFIVFHVKTSSLSWVLHRMSFRRRRGGGASALTNHR